MSKAYYNQTLKSQRQRESFEISRRTATHHTQGNPNKRTVDLSVEKLQIIRESGIIKMLKEKNPANPKYDTWQICPLKMKAR